MRKAKKPRKRVKLVKSWQTYEEAALYLLDRFARQFKLGRVEGKQIVPGKSGASWEIDAKAVSADGAGFLIVECRRYTTTRLNQKSLGALAWCIQDTGAQGGITVSPLDLQRGAKKVAAAAHVQHVILDPKSTTSDYLMRFLNQFLLGRSDAVSISDSYEIQIIQSGKVIGERRG